MKPFLKLSDSPPLFHGDGGGDAIGDDRDGDDGGGNDDLGGGSGAHDNHDVRITGTWEDSVTPCLWHVRIVRRQ